MIGTEGLGSISSKKTDGVLILCAVEGLYRTVDCLEELRVTSPLTQTFSHLYRVAASRHVCVCVCVCVCGCGCGCGWVVGPARGAKSRYQPDM